MFYFITVVIAKLMINWHTLQNSPPYTHARTHAHMHARTHTHTHTRLTALFPGLPRCASTRKVKPIWILLEQETVSGSGISWAVCKSAPCSRQITTPAPHHSVFYRTDALPAAQPTVSKHWRNKNSPSYTSNNLHRMLCIKMKKNLMVKQNTLSALSRMCLSATSGDRMRRPSIALSVEVRPPLSRSLLLPRTSCNAHTKLTTLNIWVVTTNLSRECHLCRVAGNTVWSHVACEFP